MSSSTATSDIESEVETEGADPPNHEIPSKQIQHHQAIYRIGDFVQALFYEFAELFFYESLESVTKEADHIQVVRKSDPELPEDFHEHDIFSRPFPSASIVPPECQNAVLSFRMCTSAVAFFWLVLEHFFKDLPLTITELTITQSLTPNRIILHTSSLTRDAAHYNHTIFLLHLLTTNEKFALDLTSTQFGFHETVTPWSTYVWDRGVEVKESHDFGYHAQMLHVFSEDPGWEIKIGMAVLLDGMVRHGSVPLPSMEQLCGMDDEAFREEMQGTWVPGVVMRMRCGVDFLCRKGLGMFVDGCGVVVGEERKQCSLMECVLASRKVKACEQ